MADSDDQRASVELARAQGRLDGAEARFRFVFERASTAMWVEDFSDVGALVDELNRSPGEEVASYLAANPSIVDRAGALVRIADANSAALRMFGVSSKQELTRVRRAFFADEGRPVLLRSLVAIAGGQTLLSSDASLRTFSGERFDASLTHVLPRADDLERVLVTAVRVAPAGAIRDSDPPASDADRGVGFTDAFVGILGHDLRNPLSAITTAAALLESRSDSEKISRPVSRILASADRMERMISQLLDFTRIRLGRGIQLALARADIAEIARAVVGDLEAMYKTQIQVDSRGDVVGLWDPARVGQLLATLGANACLHGTVDGTVVVALDGTGVATVHVEVRNAGAIPGERFPSIFEPFRPSLGRDARGKGASGLGLGLFIARHIVLAHGGAIDVTTGQDGETRFSVDLPRRRSPNEETEAGNGDAAAPTGHALRETR